jgi:hypothetical protein
MTVSGEDVNRAFTAQTSGSVYAGAMVNLSASQVNGDYFFHFIDGPIAGNQFKARVFAKKDPATTNFAFGVQKSSTANAVYTPFTFVPGTTYLIVVKYTIVAGAVNDTVDLFVNPVLNGVEPPPTLTATLGLDADAVDIEGVALRQGTAGNAATLTIDGIRVGTWTDVTGLATAADVSLSGRVMTADGRGITNAVVRVSGNSMAEPITVITGRRGTYFIDGLTGGETYVITVVSRRFAFSEPSRVITLNDNAFDQNFVAEGQ